MSEQSNSIYKKSVTAGDYNAITETGGVVKMMIPFFSFLEGTPGALSPQPPPYWSPQRDIALRATLHAEAMWAGAVGIAITRQVSSAWEIRSSVALRARRMQEIFLQADGRRVGWGGFLGKGLRDYVTTDNGQFIEIVRASSALGSRIVGLKHLDSLRCLRTGDPERPVIYRDRAGRQHVLRDFDVITLADMPDPGETYYGAGLCAASRAYNAIYKLATIEWYLREKVGGLHPLAIHIVNGLLTGQIEAAVEAVKEEQITRGAASYMGAVIIGTPKETPPDLVTIPLAELPDRFNRKEEFDIAILTYANALGLDVQDLQPLTGQALGTGAQSQVLDDKTKGKGLASWRQDFVHAVNEYVLDDLTSFLFIERDYRDQERHAAVQKARADVAKTRIDAGITEPAQELQILVDLDDLPKAFLPEDQTPGDAVSDSDKPEQEDDAQEDGEQARPEPEKPEAQAEKESQGDVSDSVTVALFLPAALAKTLAVPDGNPPEELHITLAYLGDEARRTLDRAALEETVARLAGEQETIRGRINGRGVFELPSGLRAHFLTLDSPALPAFRQKLVEALKADGFPVVENHGFVPHITLTYNHKDVSPRVALPASEIEIPVLTLAWGEERAAYPFQTASSKASAESLEEASDLLNKLLERVEKRRENPALIFESQAGYEVSTLKHLPGGHNQKRHGWRYGGDRLGNARRAMRGQAAGERAEYRRRAGMPEAKKVERPVRAPKTAGPDGKPIGEGLRVEISSPKRLGVSVNETIAAIESVHGDGNLPGIPVNKMSGKLTTGEFASSFGGKALYIRVSEKSQSPMITAAHEIGHYLDCSGGQHAWMISDINGLKYAPQKFAAAASNAWNKIMGSSSVTRLQEHRKGKPLEIDTGSSTLSLKPDPRYLSYALKPREIWARAYAQYIAVRSGNSRMLAELRSLQSQKGYPVHWDDKDFAPIADAIDDMFREMGWRQ